MFDLVLIDTPPVLPVTDALIVGRWSDGAILVVRYDTSRVSLVDHTRQRLLSAGIPILKTVFNGMRTTRSYYGYGSYQSYYGYGSRSHGEQIARPPETPSTMAEISTSYAVDGFGRVMNGRPR
jgi:Mrp family chromosome partitioning ATPase